MISTVIGRNVAPAWIGEKPSTFCTKSETKKNVPNIARPISSITVFALANDALRKSVRSSIGSR